jgi:hypothetical protein
MSAQQREADVIRLQAEGRAANAEYTTAVRVPYARRGAAEWARIRAAKLKMDSVKEAFEEARRRRPTRAELATEIANEGARAQSSAAQMAAQSAPQGEGPNIATTGSVNLGFGRRYKKISAGKTRQRGGRKMRGEGVLGYDISGMPFHHPGVGKGMRGGGLFDAIGDAFKAIPRAITQIPNGIIGAANNTNEIDSRLDTMQDLAGRVIPFISPAPKRKGKGSRRGRGGFLPSDDGFGFSEPKFKPAVWKPSLKLM